MRKTTHHGKLERMQHAAPVTEFYGTHLGVRDGEATVARGTGTFPPRGPGLRPEIGYL